MRTKVSKSVLGLLASALLMFAFPSAAVRAAENNGKVLCTAVSTDNGVVYACGDPLPEGTSLQQVANKAWTLPASSDQPIVPYATCGLIQNVGAPGISGNPQPGNTLNASPGSWTDPCYQIVSFGYTWNNGASGPSYNISQGDVGATLYVTVTACDTEGNCGSASSGGVTIQPGPPPPPPPAAPSASISANPQNVAYNGKTTISWGSSNASSCASTDGSPGWYTTNQATSGSWTSDVLTTQTTFTITCYGGGQAASASVTVFVGGAPLPTVTISATPNPVAWNNSTTLSWTSANSTGCNASWTSSTAVTGSQVVGPITSATTYTISCGGVGGNNSAAVLVSVSGGPAPTVNLTSYGNADGSTTLSWSSSNASSCSASWTTSNSISGSQIVGPTVSTTYTITCSGSGGSTTSAPVTVNVLGPPSVSLKASSTSITSGSSTTLSWSSSNTSSCTAPWTSSKATSGSQVLSPTASTIYTISCSNSAGTTVTSNPVTVSVASVTIDPQALPPYTGGDFSYGESDRTLLSGSKCRTAHITYTYRNLVTRYVYFRWELSENFCWKGYRVTSVYSQTAYSLEAHYPWNYEGNLTQPSTGGVGSYYATTFAQGKYQACAAFGIGCLKSVAPWAKIVANGSGGATYSYGAG